MTTMQEFFGDVIYSYTRAQAIEDGVLVDVTETAREAGFKYPVAVTQALWADIVVPSDHSRREGQSEAGRLWDVLWMATRSAGQGGPEIRYSIIVREGGRSTHRELKAICGPGDTAEPVVTIMLPDED